MTTNNSAAEQKPIHAKPSLYAFYFEKLKEIALKYGYNLVLHGSMNRDLDLIAIPWQENIGSHDEMIEEFIKEIGGSLMFSNGIDRLVAKNLSEPIKEDWKKFSTAHHGRMLYVINVNRECGEKDGEWHDPQYYLDISVMPASSPTGAELHPEAYCHECGAKNPTWSADNDLFNEVNGSPNGIMCPVCFQEMAKQKGISVIFRGEDIRKAETPVEVKKMREVLQKLVQQNGIENNPLAAEISEAIPHFQPKGAAQEEPTSAQQEGRGETWKAVPYNYQIADTGDYDGHWEITNGKITLFSKEDPEDEYKPLVAALNKHGEGLYVDDSAQWEAAAYREQMSRQVAEIESLTSQLADKDKRIAELERHFKIKQEQVSYWSTEYHKLTAQLQGERAAAEKAIIFAKDLAIRVTHGWSEEMKEEWDKRVSTYLLSLKVKEK